MESGQLAASRSRGYLRQGRGSRMMSRGGSLRVIRGGALGFPRPIFVVRINRGRFFVGRSGSHVRPGGEGREKRGVGGSSYARRGGEYLGTVLMAAAAGVHRGRAVESETGGAVSRA